jgi:aryl-alcohol dehydrogenase-like predicted oxidoreductase
VENKFEPISKKLLGKIVIGTSSWGQNYGAFNASSVEIEEINRILLLAEELGLFQLDTAPVYGNSEKLIGDLKVAQYLIYSKVSNDSWLSGTENALNEVRGSLNRLRSSFFEGLMFHSSEPIFIDAKKAQHFMQDLVERRLCKKWGVSVYTVEETEQVLEVCKPDFIQLPSNLADRRFADSGMISYLRTQGIEVHVRSVFLQGLVLQDSKELPSKFEAFSPWLSNLEKFSDECGMTKTQLAILYNLSNTDVDKVLIGVNSLSQFEEAISSIASSFEVPDFDMLPSVANTHLIDPRRW